MYSTGVLPGTIDGFIQLSTNSLELSSFVPEWFHWVVGMFWILVGTVGVIGPTRMAYERVVPIVDITAKLLSSALSHT